MKKEKTKTIKDIARELGLNHSTIGYALSGKGTVSAATRKRVIEYARQVGYSPNVLAQRMRQGKTNVIGLVVPDVMFMYVEVVQNLFHSVQAVKSELQIGLSEFNRDLENQSLGIMLDTRVEGLIVKSSFSSVEAIPAQHALRRVLAAGIPLVFWGFGPVTDRPRLVEPIEQAAELLVEHFLALGKRDVVLLLPTVPPFPTIMRTGLEGAQRRLAQEGLELRVVHLQTAAETQRVGGYMAQFNPATATESGRRMFRQALGLTPRPTAVITYNDALAIGALIEAREMGIQVPGEVGIASLMRSPSAAFAPLSLTAVDWKPQWFAQRLLDLLLVQIERGQVITPGPAECELIVGATTRG